MELLKEINKEIQDYKTRLITIVPGLYFNQYETLNTIYFYYNSKFQSGEFDAENDKKYFYNIVRNPCKIYTKMIDFDTKDIRLLTADGSDPIKTMYMEWDLKFWMKDKQFGKVLNRIFRELPIFGSCVIKVVDGVPMFVDLRNFVVEQSADSLDESNYIIELHNYTVADYRRVAKQMGWEKTDEVIAEFRKMKETSHIVVIERYGEVMDDKGVWTYRRTYTADVGINQVDNQGVLRPYKGIEIDSTEVDSHPYWEFHLEKIPGRWMGVGAVETLFEPQIRQNEIANLSAKGSYNKSMQLFQTADQAFSGRNLMTDHSTGDVVTPDSPVSQIDMGDRNLSFFNEEYIKWLKNRDELTFSYDVVQGERLPSGTPLGSAQIASSAATSYFDQIREDIALDIKEFIFEVILPQFEKDMSAAHILRIAGQNLDEVQEMIINQKAVDGLFDFAIKNGKLPDRDQFELLKSAITARVKQGKETLLDLPRNFYKNVKYAIDIDITGESKDVRMYAAALFAALQAITADPTLTTDPTKKQFFTQWLESQGIHFNFSAKPTPVINDVIKGSGGGVSSAAITQKPFAGVQSQTL